jgi:hypothetical protein
MDKIRVFPVLGLSVTILFLAGLVLSGCSSGESSSPVVPAADRPTFLFFFTDG